MSIQVNQRQYRLAQQPVVVVCVDGCEPDYLGQAVATGHMPWMKKALSHGTGLVADCVVPTFTSRQLFKMNRRMYARIHHAAYDDSFTPR